MHTHFSGQMAQNYLSRLQLDAESAVWQALGNFTLELYSLLGIVITARIRQNRVCCVNI